jgi:serine/threonine-protein kinase HipA
MLQANVYVHGILAGTLEMQTYKHYSFSYVENYNGPPVSLTMPVKDKIFEYENFPPIFEGLLPEGTMLEALLKKYKIDRNDYFKQITQVGNDLIGAVTVERKL